MDELTQWIVRAQEGEPDAWEVLYQRFEASLFRQAYHLLQDADEAADVVQEAFLRAYQQRQRLKAPEAFSQWLRTIALNLCRRRYQRRSRGPEVLSIEELRAHSQEDDRPGEIPLSSDEPSPQETMERRELEQVVQQALARLPPDQREVIVLHHLEGLEVEAIAGIIRRPAGTVKSRLARGRNRLKALLAEWVED